MHDISHETDYNDASSFDRLLCDVSSWLSDHAVAVWAVILALVQTALVVLGAS